MTLTIGETVEQLRVALQDYIEATYHISHPTLVAQRRELLEKLSVIHQRPYFESTPRYKTGAPFSELGLPESVLDVLDLVSTPSGDLPRLIHDPPYQHQASSLQKSLVNGRSLIVTTGTGSGKTECFVLPILGKLALEASERKEVFGSTSAVRALVLYPMNALVNDQLGRLRLLFGDPRVVDRFTRWAGRPARFARYTSRTLYPGVRNEKKDKTRLRAIGDYYAQYLEQSLDPSSEGHETAKTLVEELQRRGKWPAKPDLLTWYGKKGSRWKNAETGEYRRCVALQNDPELLTRHEVQEAPPDILVTNYSMLEYMLMRPLERPIFDLTRKWLRDNPAERLLVVLDEAHLYRGAAGAEVALLIRRLRARLDIPAERLQIICTSASFQDLEYSAEFGSQLVGKDANDFDTIGGELYLREAAEVGSLLDAKALCTVDIDAFYMAESDDEMLQVIKGFLRYRSVSSTGTLTSLLHEALVEFPPMARLINLTMTSAQPVEELADLIFERVSRSLSERAVTTLIALGSLARAEPSAPGLLPCRVH